MTVAGYTFAFYASSSKSACKFDAGGNAAGPNAYPISSFTWLLIPSKIADAQKKQAVTEFLHWMLTDGQGFAEPLAYSRLPREVIEKETQAISRIE